MNGMQMTERASIAVRAAAADADWEPARALLAGYRSWLVDTTGLDLGTAQPDSGAEFDAPERYYAPPDGALVVATVDGAPAGIVGVRRLHGDVGELKRMYVTPSAHGLGLGRALVTTAVAAARDLGFATLRLQTKPALMPAADRLYREQGFVEIAPYADLGLTGVVDMALDLYPTGPG